MSFSDQPTFVLTLSCLDRPGIVRDVAGRIASLDANILRAEQSSLGGDTHFYQRIEFQMSAPVESTEFLEGEFRGLASSLDAQLAIRSKDQKPRTAILVSKYGHCLRRERGTRAIPLCRCSANP
jgi:formyltetrahydrofolate deformylase